MHQPGIAKAMSAFHPPLSLPPPLLLCCTCLLLLLGSRPAAAVRAPLQLGQAPPPPPADKSSSGLLPLTPPLADGASAGAFTSCLGFVENFFTSCPIALDRVSLTYSRGTDQALMPEEVATAARDLHDAGLPVVGCVLLAVHSCQWKAPYLGIPWLRVPLLLLPQVLCGGGAGIRLCLQRFGGGGGSRSVPAPGGHHHANVCAERAGRHQGRLRRPPAAPDRRSRVTGSCYAARPPYKHMQLKGPTHQSCNNLHARLALVLLLRCSCFVCMHMA